jgi:hypothetical protein
VIRLSQQTTEQDLFRSQIEELLARLNIILSDSVKMNRFARDPEMTADLYLRIANGYKNTPDLRFTWLNALCAKHLETGNKAEAAMCVLHMAAFVSEYLAAANRDDPESARGLPRGCADFVACAPNAAEEASVYSETHADEEGCSESDLTEDGLLALLNRASKLLFEAELYELQNECLKLAIPLHEKHRRYMQLREVHTTLATAFDKIIEANRTESRLLGVFYRVGLFGMPLEDLNGTEWVYKEPKVTLLPEIKNRLVKQLQDTFGPEIKIEVITDSGAVDEALRMDQHMPSGCSASIVSSLRRHSQQVAPNNPRAWQSSGKGRRY